MNYGESTTQAGTTTDLSAKGLRRLDPNTDLVEAHFSLHSTTLDLSYNKLTSFGPGILPMNSVMRVIISHNRIASLQEALPLETWGYSEGGSAGTSETPHTNNHNVTHVDLSYNSIKEVRGSMQDAACYLFVTYLDLSNNNIAQCIGMSAVLPNLTTLILDDNCLEHVPYDLPLSLMVLRLNGNQLGSWYELRALACLAETLQILALVDNPFHGEDDALAVFYRPYLLWLCPSLHTLDGTATEATVEAEIAAKVLFRDLTTGRIDPSLVTLMDDGQELALRQHLHEAATRPLPQRDSFPNPSPEEATQMVSSETAIEVEVLKTRVQKLHDTVLRLFLADMRRRDAAAVVLQRHYRGYSLRRAVGGKVPTVPPLLILLRYHIRIQHRSATKIQKVYRGVVARRGYKRLLAAWLPYKDKFERTVTRLLQRCGRGLHWRRKVQAANVMMMVRGLVVEVRGLQNMMLRFLKNQPPAPAVYPPMSGGGGNAPGTPPHTSLPPPSSGTMIHPGPGLAHSYGSLDGSPLVC